MKKTHDPITQIWLVEDNPMFSKGVQRVVDGIRKMACTGSFHSAEAAFEALAHQDPPQVILLDVQLPGVDGIAALATFKQRAPNAKIIILTVFDDADKIFQAVCAGASGYVLKSAGMDQIGAAIHQVMEGGAPMTPEVAKKVLDAFARLTPAPEHAEDYHLTLRERDILRLMADGLVKKEIATSLGISINTVSTHIQRVYEKLHVTTNTGAVGKALREGII